MINLSYQYVAARYFARQTKKLSPWLDLLQQGDDSQAIHQARVVCRRVRAGLHSYGNCFNHKDLKRYNRHFKQLANALAAARDKDVQIQFLITFRTDAPRPARLGLDRLLLRFRQQRCHHQTCIAKGLKRFEKSAVLSDLKQWAKTTQNLIDKDQLDIRTQPNGDLARQAILSQLSGLLSFRASLDDPADTGNHHNLRIAAKRLRYTLELFKPVFGGRIGPALKEIKKLQNLAGDLQDCYIWLEELPGFIESEKQLALDYFGHTRSFPRLLNGLVFLLDNRQSRANSLLAEIRQLWQEFDSSRFWQFLTDSIESESGDISAAIPQSSLETGDARSGELNN